jgi:hypothetical protein
VDLLAHTHASPLARYDAACRVIAEARAVDEVKDIRVAGRAAEARLTIGSSQNSLRPAR